MLDPERCSELAFLVEIEAPLLRRHRIDRRTVDEDDLGLEIRIARGRPRELRRIVAVDEDEVLLNLDEIGSEEHTSELQSLMRISYAVFCLKKKKTIQIIRHIHTNTNTIQSAYKPSRTYSTQLYTTLQYKRQTH